MRWLRWKKEAKERAEAEAAASLDRAIEHQRRVERLRSEVEKFYGEKAAEIVKAAEEAAAERGGRVQVGESDVFAVSRDGLPVYLCVDSVVICRSSAIGRIQYGLMYPKREKEVSSDEVLEVVAQKTKALAGDDDLTDVAVQSMLNSIVMHVG